MKPIVLSPSNMDTFARCPLRFFGSSVSREIVWKASKAKSRGTLIHSQLEKCLRLGWQPQLSWDGQIDLSFARQMVEDTRNLLGAYDLFIEHELAIDKMSRPCGWWDENALLRAKADAILIPKDPADPIRLIDIKTGRKWDDEDFQMRVEVLLAHLIWDNPRVLYSYWYVDEGMESDGFIDFNNGLGPVADIMELMRDMLLSIKNSDYPARKNKFCKWCDWYQTPKCTLK